MQLTSDGGSLQLIRDSVVWRHLSQTNGEAVEEELPYATGGLLALERVALAAPAA